MLVLFIQLDAACTAADQFAEAVEKGFPQHPDAEILLSFPGVGIQLAARILAEIGDDRTRFADARALKALRRLLIYHPGFGQQVRHHQTLGAGP